MNRKKALAGINDFILDSDIVFCVGELLIRECSFTPEKVVLYCKDDIVDVLSVALGLSIATTKRVVVICEDNYLLRHINAIVQSSVSKCKNLFLFVIVSNVYTNTIAQTTIFESIRNTMGVFFNLGFFTYNYTNYLKTKTDVKKVKDIYKSARGPFISFIHITDQKIYSNDIKETSFKVFKELLNKKDIIENTSEHYLNLDKIMGQNTI